MKLLRRTVKNYILYSALLLLICTPLYYISIRQLFVNEMEEELFHHKNNFNSTLTKLETEKDIRLYQLINEEFQLKETSSWPISDSLFTYTRYDSLEKAMIPYRVLRTGVTIRGVHYELIIRESIVGNTKLVAAVVSIQTTLLVLMLIGFILINRKLSKVVWDPFYTILEKLKSYQIDKIRSMPITLSAIGSIMYKSLKFDDPNRDNYYTSNLYYSGQLLIARKFNESLSLQLMPTIVHYNLVPEATDPNDLFSVGIGGRMKISKRTSLNIEYYYQLPDYKLPGTTNSLAIGFDIETGGHVFQLYCTNSTGMTERTYINETTGNFFKGDIRLGFTISRVFTVKKPKS